MDANWFLQKTSYAAHQRLAAAGVLPKTLFEDSRRDQLHAQTAKIIQRRARGVQGRDRVREKLARTYRKRFDGKAFYYVNLRTQERLDARPLLVPKLFPYSAF